MMDEIRTLRNLKVNELIQVSYEDPVQLGAIDPRSKTLQVLASTAELCKI